MTEYIKFLFQYWVLIILVQDLNLDDDFGLEDIDMQVSYMWSVPSK